MSSSLWPNELQPASLLCPRDSPGKNIGVGCHALHQRNLSDSGIESTSPVFPAKADRFFTTSPTWGALSCYKYWSWNSRASIIRTMLLINLQLSWHPKFHYYSSFFFFSFSSFLFSSSPSSFFLFLLLFLLIQFYFLDFILKFWFTCNGLLIVFPWH